MRALTSVACRSVVVSLLTTLATPLWAQAIEPPAEAETTLDVQTDGPETPEAGDLKVAQSRITWPDAQSWHESVATNYRLMDRRRYDDFVRYQQHYSPLKGRGIAKVAYRGSGGYATQVTFLAFEGDEQVRKFMEEAFWRKLQYIKVDGKQIDATVFVGFRVGTRQPGEEGKKAKLKAFLNQALQEYVEPVITFTAPDAMQAQLVQAENEYRASILAPVVEAVREQRIAAEYQAEQYRIAKRQEAEREAQAAQREALAAEREAALVKTIELRFGSSPKLARIVWQGSDEQLQSVLYPTETAFNELNREVLRAEQTVASSAVFTSAPRGEFEKTANYEARVSAERAKFDADLAAARPGLVADVRKAALMRLFGSPRIVAVNYNADQEAFQIELAATRADLQIVAKVPVPLDQAQAAKAELLEATPLLLVELSPSGFITKGLVLKSADKWHEGNIAQVTRNPVVFGSQSLAAWEARLVAHREAQKAAEQKAAAERAVRDAEANRRAEIERVARNKKFNHNGRYLRGGAVMCVDLKSAMIADGIARSGNILVALPAGCGVIDEDIQPLSEASDVAGGIARVRVKGAMAPGFTNSWNVVY